SCRLRSGSSSITRRRKASAPTDATRRNRRSQPLPCHYIRRGGRLRKTRGGGRRNRPGGGRDTRFRRTNITVFVSCSALRHACRRKARSFFAGRVLAVLTLLLTSGAVAP